MVNSGSESDRESNSLTREGSVGEWGGGKERDRESVMRMSRRREREKCISSGKSVENKTLFCKELGCSSWLLIMALLALVFC